ncbi:3'-5' exonuclease [Tropicimonas isoalkanivorans]|uniref:DNA-directed DNA polymerase n=1 Tax=Tropicimonas isoalkanivorans TaxID=441112 RepID=A0A1I1NKZ6_9RHOB|nr:exonuclease domain-containing protein [Tropicimonas isoalkanivorans]SFC98086.1 DNA polymerase-3 subunit epsilon [Tropicimonas isoalkanivorans]
MHDWLARRLNLRLRVFLFFAMVALGGLASVGLGLWLGYRRVEEAGLGSGFVLAGLISGAGILALVVWVWMLFDENVAKAIQKLAGGIRARAHADVAGELDHESARYLGDLAPAAKAITGTLAETKNALAEAVERETTRLAVENARLQSLLADVPAGVLLCSPDHQIVFYNAHAQELLSGEVSAGLDRSILDYIRAGPLQNAYARLTQSEDVDAACSVLCASTQTGEVLAGRMRLVNLPQRSAEAAGYVLTLRDVTADLALRAGREELLDEIFDKVRRPAANLQTVLDSGVADQDAATRKALLVEAAALTHAITDLGSRYDDARGGWWPMEEIRASELVESVVAVTAREGITLIAEAERLMLRCDAFQIVALLSHLCGRLVEVIGAAALSLRIADDGEGGALVTLGWKGDVLQVGLLEGWLDVALEVGLANVTGRTVLAAHGTEAWPEPGAVGRNLIRLPLREAWPVGTPAPAVRRSAVYDFDLMDREPSGELAMTPLRELTCVVFDTETTGLLPSSGDEIVQIAALRLLGGKRIHGEAFESLVNPGRPIPAVATEVHHITNEMVAGAPDIGTVGRRFHAFAQGSVLVAHNAPFDLEFLRRREAEIGKSFDHPVLDTVLLSAVVFGQSEVHTLDALTERLGITIPPEARHTAMGDTIATAAALEKMIPMLEGRGYRTFGEVIAAVRQHGRLLKDVNSPEHVSPVKAAT